MAIKNKFSKWTLFAGSLLWTTAAGAYELQMNTAKMQAMDKITGRVSVIEVPVNSEVRFGSFSIVVIFKCTSCHYSKKLPKIMLSLMWLMQIKTASCIIFLRAG